MFETEAEEHCNKTLCSVCEKVDCAFEGIKCREWRDRRVGFYCGAEFGYNKANEWHFVKNGDLPKEDTKVIALMADKEIYIAHFYRRNVWDKIGTVIAWKEIVLPELKESE